MTDDRSPEPPSAAPLGDVLERITDGIFALDAEWRIVYINSRARELLDARDRSILGEDFLRAFPRARDAAFVREYRLAMQEQRPREFVEHSKTVDRWFHVQVYPSSNGLSVYFLDVTERVLAERERGEREARQEALIGYGREALGRVSTERLVADALALLKRHVPVALAAIHLYDPLVRAYRDGPPLTAEAIGELRAGRPVVALDLRRDPRFTGGGGWLEAEAALFLPVGTESDPLAVLALGGTAAQIENESDRRFAEAVLTTLGEALRAKMARRRNREILESITDAFVACDADLRITYVNERMAAFWQMRADEIVGRPLEEFARRGGTSAESIAAYRSAIETHRSSTFETFFPETERWFESRVYPYAGGVAGYVRDITRRKAAELQIRELNVELERRVRERTQQLEAANADLEAFAYSVSHDLRAPLRAIDGFSQALEEEHGRALDAGAARHLERVRAAARRMGDLIDALLDLARLARRPMSFARVNLSAIARGVVDDLRRDEPGRDVRVLIDDDLVAYGEPALLRAAVENLVANAWKFTRRATAPEIHVGRSSDGAFFVRDNGAGFDMAYADKLFSAFGRLHDAEEFEGTGVGLATVAKIVSRHGGTVRAEGSPGRGATFAFTLPTEEARPKA